MTNRLLIASALLVSAAAGAALGTLVLQADAPDVGRRDVQSITGVNSGVDGARAKPPENDGVDRVAAPPEPTIEAVTTDDGSMQSIRGIKGIDTVMLQNLEAVLRMQAPPPPPEEGGGGGLRAAAALMTMENEEPQEPEEEIDGREELTEIELEGS